VFHSVPCRLDVKVTAQATAASGDSLRGS
jgi:hypothetical protein